MIKQIVIAMVAALCCVCSGLAHADMAGDAKVLPLQLRVAAVQEGMDGYKVTVRMMTTGAQSQLPTNVASLSYAFRRSLFWGIKLNDEHVVNFVIPEAPIRDYAEAVAAMLDTDAESVSVILEVQVEGYKNVEQDCEPYSVTVPNFVETGDPGFGGSRKKEFGTRQEERTCRTVQQTVGTLPPGFVFSTSVDEIEEASGHVDLPENEDASAVSPALLDSNAYLNVKLYKMPWSENTLYKKGKNCINGCGVDCKKNVGKSGYCAPMIYATRLTDFKSEQ